MKKQFLLFLVFSTLLFSLTGCSKKSKTDVLSIEKYSTGDSLKCSEDNVSIRSSSTFLSDVITKIYKFEIVTVLSVGEEIKNINGNSNYWYEISTTNGEYGWVFGNFLTKLN